MKGPLYQNWTYSCRQCEYLEAHPEGQLNLTYFCTVPKAWDLPEEGLAYSIRRIGYVALTPPWCPYLQEAEDEQA